MFKVRGAERPAMPPAMVRLRAMFQASCNGGIATEDGCSPCFVCGAFDVLDRDHVGTCPICLRSCHKACAVSLCSAIATAAVRLPLRPEEPLPVDFRREGATCHLCFTCLVQQ
eukprot:9121726-Lingulodinium_polyedra.AAC.2